MVVISSLLTCLFLQKKKLQAISTDILDSFNNLNEKKKNQGEGEGDGFWSQCQNCHQPQGQGQT